MSIADIIVIVLVGLAVGLAAAVAWRKRGHCGGGCAGCSGCGGGVHQSDCNKPKSKNPEN